MAETTHPRRTRGQAVAEARHQRRLTAAGDDPGALFMVYVDRIRALKDALLTRAATSLLADLIENPKAVRAGISHPCEIQGAAPVHSRDLHECLESGRIAREIEDRSTPVKTNPKETS